ncbi:MAG: hypothetical protein WCE81_03505 [Halobacteriota archaeon]
MRRVHLITGAATVMGAMASITHNVYDVIIQLWKNTTLAPRDRLSLYMG